MTNNNGNGNIPLNRVTVSILAVIGLLFCLAGWFINDQRIKLETLQTNFYEYKLMVADAYVKNDEYHRDLAEIKVILRDIQSEIKELRKNE